MNKKPEDHKPKISRKKKVLLGVAGLLVVGGIGSAVTGGPEETPETPVSETATDPPTVVDSPPPSPEPTSEPSETTVVDPPPGYVPGMEPTEPYPSSPIPEEIPSAEEMVAKYDLPQGMDDAYVEAVIREDSRLAYLDPDAMVMASMNACVLLENGANIDDVIDLATSEIYDPEAVSMTSTAIAFGAGWYCPELNGY